MSRHTEDPAFQIPDPTSRRQARHGEPVGTRGWGVGFRILIAALALAAVGCGKKGPPLAPLIRVPAAVQAISAKRVGSDAYVTVTVPGQNIDGSMPAEVSRVDVYAITDVTPPRGRFVDAGATIVATVVVAPPPRPGEPPDASPTAGALRGMAVTVRDTLDADELTPKPPAPVVAERPPAAGVAAGAAAAPGPLRRFYMAIAFTGRGRPGPPGTVAELPLTTLPDPPAVVTASYSASVLTLTWEPSGGLFGFLMDRALPPELAPFDVPSPSAIGPAIRPASLPPGPTTYNVYREIARDPLVLPAAPASAPPGEQGPVPVNPAPIAATTYTEPVTLDERERCFVVRALRGAPPDAIEGEPSSRTCVTPIDVFAPAAPADLQTLPGDRAINLIWAPNTEPDLAGYLVLRGEAGGDTLASLTREPIAEARFTDDTVVPGVRYVYEVIAVDGRLPLPNRSEPARVEDVAR